MFAPRFSFTGLVSGHLGLDAPCFSFTGLVSGHLGLDAPRFLLLLLSLVFFVRGQVSVVVLSPFSPLKVCSMYVPVKFVCLSHVFVTYGMICQIKVWKHALLFH